MTIHFFTKGDASIPSVRTRVNYLAEELERLGYQTTIHPLGATADGGQSASLHLGMFWKYLSDLRAIPPSDPLILQRTIYNKYFLLAALVARTFYGRRFIFDIDDAVYLHSKWKTLALARTAEAMICAGEYVATWARQQNRHVRIIPTGIKYETIIPFRKDYTHVNPEPVIGWVGNGPAHWPNLTFLAPVLQRLTNEHVAFRFTLVGAMGDARIPELFSFLGDRLRIVDRLPPDAVFQEIRTFDIGVMPLREDPWANAKYLKTIEYMACAVPPVASRLGENASIITQGINGMTALTENEWYDVLRDLLAQPEKRQQMGEAATKEAAKYAISKNAERFIALLKELSYC